jgi:Holliday junction resolvasome RuvABC ATP-dependent DNA helicase subunit
VQTEFGLIRSSLSAVAAAPPLNSRRFGHLRLEGEPGSGKTEAFRVVADELGAEMINVNLALSTKLLELTERQRALRDTVLLGEVVQNVGR